jgi:hypothetical protein
MPSAKLFIPPAVAHIWQWFCELSQTRQIGMSAGPITFAEIEAYARLMKIEMHPWAVALIRRIDQAVMAAEREKSQAPKADPNAIPIGDAAGVKAMFKRISGKQNG